QYILTVTHHHRHSHICPYTPLFRSVIIENSRRCTARQTKAIAYCSQAAKSRAPLEQPAATPAMAEARSLDRTEKCIYHAARSSERKYAENVQPSTISILVLRVLILD